MDEPNSIVELVVTPPLRPLDDIHVRRALPTVAKRSVGPFVFFDSIGPSRIAPGGGLDVRPHPHIGLATVTYLFEGEILHRDSLGSVQPIRPGEVNWMTAGRGIVHSERTPPQLRTTGSAMSGIQVWVALPRADEECEPSFVHHGAHELPTLDASGVAIRVIIGAFHGARSPVATRSEMVYADVRIAAGACLEIPADTEERAFFVTEGEVATRGAGPATTGQLVVLKPGAAAVVDPIGGPARVLVLGGARLDGERHLFWNFVASSKDRIQQAAEDWRAGRFPGVPGETEFIPLPDPPAPVRYP